MIRRTLLILLLIILLVLANDAVIAKTAINSDGVELELDTLFMIVGQVAFSVYFVLNQNSTLRSELVNKIDKEVYKATEASKEKQGEIMKDLAVIETKLNNLAVEFEKSQGDLKVFKVQIKSKIQGLSGDINRNSLQVQENERDISDIFNKVNMVRRNGLVAKALPADEEAIAEENSWD